MLSRKVDELKEQINDAQPSRKADQQRSKYHANFDKPHYGFSYEWMQNYRLICAGLSSPIWVCSIIYNGIHYFLKYATQWVSILTTIYFLLCWQSARKNRALEQLLHQRKQQSSTARAASDDELAGNSANSESE